MQCDICDICDYLYLYHLSRHDVTAHNLYIVLTQIICSYIMMPQLCECLLLPSIVSSCIFAMCMRILLCSKRIIARCCNYFQLPNITIPSILATCICFLHVCQAELENRLVRWHCIIACIVCSCLYLFGQYNYHYQLEPVVVTRTWPQSLIVQGYWSKGG